MHMHKLELTSAIHFQGLVERQSEQSPRLEAFAFTRRWPGTLVSFFQLFFAHKADLNGFTRCGVSNNDEDVKTCSCVCVCVSARTTW